MAETYLHELLKSVSRLKEQIKETKRSLTEAASGPAMPEVLWELVSEYACGGLFETRVETDIVPEWVVATRDDNWWIVTDTVAAPGFEIQSTYFHEPVFICAMTIAGLLESTDGSLLVLSVGYGETLVCSSVSRSGRIIELWKREFNRRSTPTTLLVGDAVAAGRLALSKRKLAAWPRASCHGGKICDTSLRPRRPHQPRPLDGSRLGRDELLADDQTNRCGLSLRFQPGKSHLRDTGRPVRPVRTQLVLCAVTFARSFAIKFGHRATWTVPGAAAVDRRSRTLVQGCLGRGDCASLRVGPPGPKVVAPCRAGPEGLVLVDITDVGLYWPFRSPRLDWTIEAGSWWSRAALLKQISSCRGPSGNERLSWHPRTFREVQCLDCWAARRTRGDPGDATSGPASSWCCIWLPGSPV